MEKSVERTQRTFIVLALGIPCALFLLGFGIWGGWRVYERWEEGHLVRRAAAFLSGGDLKATTLSARRALQLNPNSSGAARIMGQVAEQAHDRAAIEWRRKVLELNPQSPDDKLALAECAIQFGDVKMAEKTLSSLEETNKPSPAFHAAMGRLFKAKNQLSEAKQSWAEALRLSPDNESCQLQLGLICLEQSDGGSRRQGIDLLQRLRTSPTQRAAATRALILDGVARHDDAGKLRDLAKELQNYPEALFTDRMLYLEILRQLQDPQYPVYLAKMEEEVANKPADAAALLTWMNANAFSREALRMADSLPKEIVTKWPVPWARAEALAKLADWDALEKFTRNVDWGQFDFLRRAYLARAFRAQEKTAEAEREWTGSVKTASSQPQALLLLTRLTAEWRWTDRTVDLLWALAKHPDKQNEALMGLYQHYAKTGDTQGLYRVLVRLSELDPTDMRIQNNLAQISLLLDADVERARQIAADLYHKDPRNPAYVSTYAYSLRSKGDANAAVNVMNSLPAERLHDPATAAYYGIVLAAAGEKEKARKYLEIGKTATLLPEEKMLVDRATAASN